jgi:hypothetical protein
MGYSPQEGMAQAPDVFLGLVRPAMDADVGRFIQPAAGGNKNGLQAGELEAGQDVRLYVKHGFSHTSFFVRIPGTASLDRASVMPGKIQIVGMRDRRLAVTTDLHVRAVVGRNFSYLAECSMRAMIPTTGLP